VAVRAAERRQFITFDSITGLNAWRSAGEATWPRPSSCRYSESSLAVVRRIVPDAAFPQEKPHAPRLGMRHLR
jgi:hypothetical protein